MSHVLTWIVVLYFVIGLSITAFCVHMSYHEAAVGFGDNDDLKAQRVLESKIGPLGFVFLFTFWPIALLIAFVGKGQPDCDAQGHPLPPKESADAASPVQAAEKS
jgi:hypothetical protein